MYKAIELYFSKRTANEYKNGIFYDERHEFKTKAFHDSLYWHVVVPDEDYYADSDNNEIKFIADYSPSIINKIQLFFENKIPSSATNFGIYTGLYCSIHIINLKYKSTPTGENCIIKYTLNTGEFITFSKKRYYGCKRFLTCITCVNNVHYKLSLNDIVREILVSIELSGHKFIKSFIDMSPEISLNMNINVSDFYLIQKPKSEIHCV